MGIELHWGWLTWGIGASILAIAAGRLVAGGLLPGQGACARLRQGIAALGNDDYATAIRCFRRARSRAIRRGDLLATAAAWRGIAIIRQARGETEAAGAAYASALDAEAQAAGEIDLGWGPMRIWRSRRSA